MARNGNATNSVATAAAARNQLMGGGGGQLSKCVTQSSSPIGSGPADDLAVSDRRDPTRPASFHWPHNVEHSRSERQEVGGRNSSK